tara:strand:+ start:975 stop:1103 length:129 start_codon:yes stop_codon:yes gene_type:complete
MRIAFGREGDGHIVYQRPSKRNMDYLYYFPEKVKNAKVIEQE